jgi:hypothetical protein
MAGRVPAICVFELAMLKDLAARQEAGHDDSKILGVGVSLR